MRDVKPIATRARVPRGQAQAAGRRRASPPPIAPWCSWKACRGLAKARSPTPATRSPSAAPACRTASCASSGAANTASKTCAICTACASMRPRRRLREFLADALAHNLRCVRIIHGKGKDSGPQGTGHQDRGEHDPAQDGAGAGIHVGAPRRRRHRRHQRVAVRVTGQSGTPLNAFVPARLSASCEHRPQRSCVAGANHISAPIAPNSRSWRQRVTGIAEQIDEVAPRQRARAQHRLARQRAEFARHFERARGDLRRVAKLVDQSHAQRRGRIDQRTAREQLRGVTAHQPLERAVNRRRRETTPPALR